MKTEKENHNLTPDEVLKKFNTSFQGLSEEEAENRLKEYGLNELSQAKVDSLAVIYFRQFKSPLIYLLLAAALVVFLTGEMTDGLVILFVIVFNSVVGSIQEGRAQNTLLALKKMAETSASVIRDGRELIIPDKELVPGDIIVLREGDKIPADAVIIRSNSLKVDEAALTGESFYKNKSEEVIENESKSPVDQNNLVFKATYVVSGNAKAAVTATGLGTYIGKISREASLIDSEIPLKKDIAKLSRLIIYAVSSVCALLVIIGLLKGEGFGNIVKFSISVAVSVIPEGLPIVLTLVLATGVWRMSRSNILVKRLQAVEALGQTDVIAVDKTGTLTKNELSVEKVFCGEKNFFIKGSGYEPKGEINLENKVTDPLNHPDLLMAGKISVFCSNAQVTYLPEAGNWKISGDPVEAAMLVFSEKVGFRREILENEAPRIDEIPFDYRTKVHLSLHREEGENFLAGAGAPEIILKLCTKYRGPSGDYEMTKAKLREFESVFFSMAKQGLRVIALGAASQKENKLKSDNLPKLSLVGFLGMKDTLRSEAREAVEKTQEAGIEVIMMTGDHTIAAETIAGEAGINCQGKKIITGNELEKMSDPELENRIGEICVFSRVMPEHKLRIIEAYKNLGKTVAMTGDGVNDTLSLAAADLGVAMGKVGTEVAKEASDIVILDDNFGSLAAGVKEGRNIFKTIKKVLLYLFSTSAGELLTIFATFAIGFPLPIQAVQILWLNLVTDGFLDVALAMEPREKGLLRKKFARGARFFVDKLMAQRMIIMAAVMAIGTLFLFGKYYEESIQKGWTISLTTLAVFQWFNAWNCKSENKSIFKINPLFNPYLIGATFIVVILQVFAVYNPFMQKILHTVPLSLSEWGLITAVSFSIIVVEEIRKLLYKLKGRQ